MEPELLAALTDERLSSRGFRLLCLYRSDNANCKLSVKHTAKLLGWSKAKVTRVRKELEELGYGKRRRRMVTQDADGNWHSLSSIFEVAPPDSSPVSPPTAPGQVTSGSSDTSDSSNLSPGRLKSDPRSAHWRAGKSDLIGLSDRREHGSQMTRLIATDELTAKQRADVERLRGLAEWPRRVDVQTWIRDPALRLELGQLLAFDDETLRASAAAVDLSYRDRNGRVQPVQPAYRLERWLGQAQAEFHDRRKRQGRLHDLERIVDRERA